MRELRAVSTLRDVWVVHYERCAYGHMRWREVGERGGSQAIETLYDPDARWATKRSTDWVGYKLQVTETDDADLPHLMENLYFSIACVLWISCTLRPHCPAHPLRRVPEPPSSEPHRRRIARRKLWLRQPSPPSATSTTRAITYAYDDAGNRTGGWVNGTRVITQRFDAANQVNGFTYDAAGNLTNDGNTSYTYDALNRLLQQDSTVHRYNGNGVLSATGGITYTQDLAAPLSQVVQTTQGSTTTSYLYGLDRLAAVTGSTRTWYGTDALGSVRLTISAAGLPLSVVNYDPWGTVETGSVPTFGFTGEVQSGGLVNLRARWYATGQGRFVSVDPLGSMGVSNTYAYASDNPGNHVDAWGLLDYQYSSQYTSAQAVDDIRVALKLIMEKPITGWGAFIPNPVEAMYYQNGRLASLSIAASMRPVFPNAAQLLSHYFENTGGTVDIDFHAMAAAAPQSIKHAFDEEFGAAKSFVEKNDKNEGTYHIYSTDYSEQTIFGTGPGIYEKESPDWFVAVNDFQAWGTGSVIVSCGANLKTYRIALALHMFDLYDWEPPPGQPDSGITIKGVKIRDEELSWFHRYGSAKYFYVREDRPVVETRTYIKIGRSLFQWHNSTPSTRPLTRP